jgi:acetolactate synthase-1/2/3 large subunit
MRVADYIIQRLYAEGVETIFMVSGGMIMHLTDAICVHPEMQFVCHNHEQAAVMAAEALGRFTGRPGVAMVTAGPGALNTLTSVAGAYVDGSPCIILAGQSKLSQARVTNVRQFPLQGWDTEPIFEHVVKYFIMIEDVDRVKYELEKCIYKAKQGRPGPVWFEVPLDIQGMQMDPDLQVGYSPMEIKLNNRSEIDKAMDLILKSKKPLILAGAGVRVSGARTELLALAETHNIPIVTSRLGMDLVPYDHFCFVGHPGTYGDRAANFAINNCDLLISIGCRMAIGLIGHDYDKFAPKAKKIMVDIDWDELEKPSLNIDLKIEMDAREFVQMVRYRLPESYNTERWRFVTQSWKFQFPVCLKEYIRDVGDGINSYVLMDILSQLSREGDVFVVDTGSCFHAFAQAFRVKEGQRCIITGGLSTMGYMPAVIGVAEARKKEADPSVYCITGDGSIQFNIQELGTIARNGWPIKIIVVNNDGYLLIRQTQKNFQDGRHIGEGMNTGLGLPQLSDVASAYGIDYEDVKHVSSLRGAIERMQDNPLPCILDVISPRNQVLQPRIASKMIDGKMVSSEYDDMFPHLPRD